MKFMDTTNKIVDQISFETDAQREEFIVNFHRRYDDKRIHFSNVVQESVQITLFGTYPDLVYYLRWLIDNKYLRSKYLQRVIVFSSKDHLSFVENINLKHQKKIAQLIRVFVYPVYFVIKVVCGDNSQVSVHFENKYINIVI